MNDAIKQFAQQFSYAPEVVNSDKLGSFEKFIVLGMGGSHLAADLLLSWRPEYNITIHSDYDLPAGDISNTLIIASSYSGNTEEVIDGLTVALKKNLPVAVIAVGGKLIEIAKEKNLPYVQMPDTGIQPRSALGYSFKSMLAVIKDSDGLTKTTELAGILNPDSLEEKGKQLAAKLKDHVPVIYTSTRNRAIAYNWKIKLDETGKIPAFYNVLPELNHNEMTGFDIQSSSKHLSEQFYFIMLKDSSDHKRVQKRMQILAELYKSRDLPIEVIDLIGSSALEKIFSSLILADWTAFYTAELYGLESEQVPMVEEFKDLMKK